jgi:hypothetical protein
MIRSILLATASIVFSVSPVSAELVKTGSNTFVATDADDNTHLITVVRQDKDGDMVVRVVTSNGGEERYWIDCERDIAHLQGGNEWFEIDHRTMVGWYSDAACRR